MIKIRRRTPTRIIWRRWDDGGQAARPKSKIKCFFFSMAILGLTLVSSCSNNDDDPGPSLSSDSRIAVFSFSSLNASGTISGNDIAVNVPFGTDVTALSPTIITVSAGASITPASGLERDFSSPVTYAVISEDQNNSSVYTLTVTIAEPDSVVISEFEVAGAQSVTIDQEESTININFLENTDVTALVPTITATPESATVRPASGEAQNFTRPVTYTVSLGTLSNAYTATASVDFVPVGPPGLDFDPVTTVLDASAASSSLPAELDSSGDNQRGFSMNSENVYAADRGEGVVHYWNVDGSSAAASTLANGSVVSGGVFAIADVVATENGILASNMNWNSGEFKVYRWDSNDGEPEVLLTYTTEYKGDSIRLGDAINFVGDPQDDGKLYAMPFPGFNSIANNNFVYVWDVVGGTIADQANPDLITFAGLAAAGNYGYVQPVSSGGTDYLLVNGANITPTLYSADGATKLTTIQTDAINNRSVSGQIFEFNNARYLGVALAGSEGGVTRDAGILLYDISGDDIVAAMNAITADTVGDLLVYENSIGDNLNGNIAADTAVYIDATNEQVYVMIGAANNGFRVVRADKAE